MLCHLQQLPVCVMLWTGRWEMEGWARFCECG